MKLFNLVFQIHSLSALNGVLPYLIYFCYENVIFFSGYFYFANHSKETGRKSLYRIDREVWIIVKAKGLNDHYSCKLAFGVIQEQKLAMVCLFVGDIGSK